jgi:hypothetical protein
VLSSTQMSLQSVCLLWQPWQPPVTQMLVAWQA